MRIIAVGRMSLVSGDGGEAWQFRSQHTRNTSSAVYIPTQVARGTSCMEMSIGYNHAINPHTIVTHQIPVGSVSRYIREIRKPRPNAHTSLEHFPSRLVNTVSKLFPMIHIFEEISVKQQTQQKVSGFSILHARYPIQWLMV